MSFEHDEQCIENDARCDCYADRIATLERELAEMLRDWTEDVNKCERVERELDAVSAERDALLAGKWAGPWKPGRDPADYVRRSPQDDVAHSTVTLTRDGWYWNAGTEMDWCASPAVAMAAADAHLLAAGWYLAPTPPT